MEVWRGSGEVQVRGSEGEEAEKEAGEEAKRGKGETVEPPKYLWNSYSLPWKFLVEILERLEYLEAFARRRRKTFFRSPSVLGLLLGQQRRHQIRCPPPHCAPNFEILQQLFEF